MTCQCGLLESHMFLTKLSVLSPKDDQKPNCEVLFSISKLLLQYIDVAKRNESIFRVPCTQHPRPCSTSSIMLLGSLLVGPSDFHRMNETRRSDLINEFENDIKGCLKLSQNLILTSLKSLFPQIPDVALRVIDGYLKPSDVKFVEEFEDDEDLASLTYKLLQMFRHIKDVAIENWMDNSVCFDPSSETYVFNRSSFGFQEGLLTVNKALNECPRLWLLLKIWLKN